MRVQLDHYPTDHQYRVAFAIRIGEHTLSLVLLRWNR